MILLARENIQILVGTFYEYVMRIIRISLNFINVSHQQYVRIDSRK